MLFRSPQNPKTPKPLVEFIIICVINMFSLLNNKMFATVLAMLASDALATYCPSMVPINVGNYDYRGKFVAGTEGVMKNCNYC